MYKPIRRGVAGIGRSRQRGFIINPYAFGGSAPSSNVALAHFFGGASNLTVPAPDEISANGYWSLSGGATWGAFGGGLSPPYAGVGIGDCGGSAAGKSIVSAGFTQSELNLGAGDFTIDFWIRYEALPIGLTVFRYYDGGGQCPWAWNINTGGQIKFWASGNGTSYDLINGQNVHIASTGVWYHYAATRSGSDVRLFVDGALVATVNIGSAALYSPTTQIGLGSASTRHYISEFRIKKSAEWTASFTVPATKYSNGYTEQVPTSGQIFSLLHFDGINGSTTITESAPSTTLSWSATSPAVISTAQSKFGGASLNATGAGGKVSAAYDAAMILGSSDWTIAAWAYPTTTDQGFIFDWRSTYGQIIQAFSSQWQFLASTSGSSYEVNIVSEVADWVLNSWNHVAMCRRGNVIRAYLNGKWIGSRYVSGSMHSPGSPYYVGGYASAFWFRGHTDEFVVLKGCGQWATDATFTPPSAPY